MNLASVKREVQRLDRHLSPSREEFQAAVYLLSCCENGPDKLRLAAFTGYPPELTNKWYENAVRSEVFKDGKVYHSGWDDKKTGGIGFWCDVATLCGLLERVRSRRGIGSHVKQQAK